MKKAEKPKRVQIEFDEKHLPLLLNALETYSRLCSGQIGMAMDTVYADRWLTHEERDHIENTIRYYAFPQNPRREYDNGHEEFYDQYNNVYDENGQIVEESEQWKRFKDRPHLDHPHSSFGVSCKEMKQGTVAFELKKVIAQYLHYKFNEGFRSISNVDGDGMKFPYSDIPKAEIIGFKPQKEFAFPKKYQQKIEAIHSMEGQKRWDKVWEYVGEAFKQKPLPRGSVTRIEKIKNEWHVVVEEPYKLS